MQNSAKYLIHANITTDGVVERSDVVGAVFGQTEGLLGDELDLRDLQDSSKVGRIDVEINSENGQSFGELTIATSLDKVETAILAAALETIDRVGPCRSTVEVDRIEDVRAAKRREVVERAKALLQGSFEGTVFTSDELVEEVRRSIRVEDAIEYEGLPAGPNVVDSDAIVVVEGRADVLTLLRYGVKNAVAVEGTDVPDAVAELTRERTVTAFLDGDRGGDLILKELAQVGSVDYVAFAPQGRSVEDLDRHEVMAALREKVPYDAVADAADPHETAATDGSATPAPETAPPDGPERPDEADSATAVTETIDAEPASGDETTGDSTGEETTADATGDDDTDDDDDEETPESASEEDPPEPETLRGHVREVVDGETGRARLLDAGFATVEEADAADAFDLVKDAAGAPETLVLDAELSQRVLDVAAQRGLGQVVARSTGEFVKRPTGVRVRTAEALRPDGASQ